MERGSEAPEAPLLPAPHLPLLCGHADAAMPRWVRSKGYVKAVHYGSRTVEGLQEERPALLSIAQQLAANFDEYVSAAARSTAVTGWSIDGHGGQRGTDAS